ncbi:MAG: c-type cytochrome [Proteobacteria bacterium]|nr:c-type cytochrome [Pseudomonadota bacterium]
MYQLRLSAMRSLVTAAILATASMPSAADSQEIGDAKRGYDFAAQHCAECHAIDFGNPKSPNADAPSFTSVAQTSGMSGRALAVWLDTTHPTMPNFVLHADDRDDVIAYIMSLKNRPPPK